MSRFSWFFSLLSLLSLFLLPQANAVTYINHSRLVINESKAEVSFSIRNEGESAVLMQLWSDHGNITDKPESIRMPFIIQPPLFRLNAKDSRRIRLQTVDGGRSLPKNTESLYWLNALEIPSKTKNDGFNNTLQIAFRTRIKIFYRPVGIEGLRPENEVNKISHAIVKCGNSQCIELNNPTPLHFTLLSIKLSDGQSLNALPNDGVISPHSSMLIPLKTGGHHRVQLKSLNWIDDYGVENTNLIGQQ